ncbi:hypothetical protein ACFX2J_042925 [Malus domestica]
MSYSPQFQDIFVNDSVSSGTQDQSSGSIGTASGLYDHTMGSLASSLRFQEFETHSSTSYTLSSPTNTSPLLLVLDSSLLHVILPFSPATESINQSSASNNCIQTRLKT